MAIDFGSLPVWDWISQVCRTYHCRCLVKTCLFFCWRQAGCGWVADQLRRRVAYYCPSVWKKERLVLARAYESTLHGCRSIVADPVLQPYFSRKHELSVGQGCVLWVYVFLSPKHIAFACWMTCIKNIMASVGWSLWQELIFGGPDWIRPSEIVLVRVMFVQWWGSLPLSYPCTRGSGLSNRGNAYTSIFKS